MFGTRKLGRTSAQRKAMLRQLTTDLLEKGRIETTFTRAKEVQPIAEKLITLAVSEYENGEIVKVERQNDKAQTVEVDAYKDKPSKLAARRQIMAYLYDIPEAKSKKESKKEYAERTADKAHPVVEKLFRELAPKYAARIAEGKKGGYTRLFKLGPRRGDAAEMAILELVD